MPKLRRVSGREAIRALEQLGFEQVRQRGRTQEANAGRRCWVCGASAAPTGDWHIAGYSETGQRDARRVYGEPVATDADAGLRQEILRKGHLHTDMTVRGSKTAVELKNVLIDTGATYTVLPEEVLEEVGAGRIPTEVEVELGNGQRVKAKAYGVAIAIEEVEAPAISITFEGGQTVIGVETLESIGLKLDPPTGRLEFTRPKGIAYFYQRRSRS